MRKRAKLSFSKQKTTQSRGYVFYTITNARSSLLPTVMLHKSIFLWNSPLRYNVTLNNMNQPIRNPTGRPKSRNNSGIIQKPKLCKTGP